MSAPAPDGASEAGEPSCTHRVLRLATALTFAFIIPVAAQEPPATFRDGPQRSGVFDTKGVDQLGGIAWRFESGGPIRSSPVLANGTVYFGSTDGSLYALNAETGDEVWRFPTGQPIAGAAMVTDSKVVVADRSNRIHALDRQTGTLLWQVETGPDLPLPWGWEGWDYILSSPVLWNDIVLYGSGDGYLYALNLVDGKQLWRYQTGGRIRSAPAIHDDMAYFGSGDGIIHGVSLTDGSGAWSFETAGHSMNAEDFGFDRTQIYSSPAIVGGTMYVGSRDASLYAIDLESREAKWTFEDGTAWVIASPAVSGDRVFSARSSGGRVRSLDAETGEELWVDTTGALVFSSPVVVGNTVYYGGGDDRVYAFDTDTGEERWNYRTGGSIYGTPAVWDGRLYVGSDDGFMYALEDADGPQPRLAVFWDDSLMSRAIWGGVEGHRRAMEYFRSRGYDKLGSAGLEAFLTERVSDGTPSAVVFAMDALPESVADSASGSNALLRRYLDAGGKVVWMGYAPLLVVRDDEGEFQRIDRSLPSRLLDVDHQAWNGDEYGVTPTDAGRLWGFKTGWVGWPGIQPGPDLTVLAVEELGRAAAWVKNYGGPPGTGFVQARPGTGRPYLDELRTVVEYGILRGPN